MNFENVAVNLRESFRTVAASRAAGENRELRGVSIASAGVTFQMFDAAFLSGPVGSEAELSQRILLALIDKGVGRQEAYTMVQRNAQKVWGMASKGAIEGPALLDALNDYEGAVIIITHDRSLMELVADRLWLTADGHIKSFKGDMDDYARFVLERARVGSRPSQDDETDGARPQGERRGEADARDALTREQQAARQARYAAKKAAKLKRRGSRGS